MKIFWSYAKLDNKKPRKLTKLREAFNGILDQTTGSSNQIIVDENDIHWGVEWKQEIDNLIISSDVMISIISPSYFNSRMCIYEFKTAAEIGIKVLPLYYRECKNGFHSSFKEGGDDENASLNSASKKIADIQYKDFRSFRNKKPHDEDVQDFLDHLANEIA